MANPPVIFQANSLDSMVARMNRWARERLNADVCRDSINDAIESLWMAASLATLSKFIGRPVQQFIPAQSSSFSLVTIPDPTDTYLVLSSIAGGALPIRTYAVGFTYVTDSGSETAVSQLATVELAAGSLASADPPPLIPTEALGWNLYADNGDGRLVLQNAQPLAFSTTWIEGPAGLVRGGPLAPSINTTADNIAYISRLDIANQDQTFTPWIQTDISSYLFSAYQNRYPLASTFPRHAYDLLGDRTVEFRPLAGTDFDATLFYVTRPRRLRYPNSRLPFFTFPAEKFLSSQALADVLGSLGEDDIAKRFQDQADRERLAILLSITNESSNQNKTVKPYMR